MQPQKLIAIVLLVIGALALVYGGFSYTRETHEANVGPLQLSIADKQRVNIPMWAGVAAVLIGGALLTMGRKR
jgi:TRAP-type C4-dicarboxylate transport system permease small subunit